MSVVHGTYRGGHVDLDDPVDWAEGERVAIHRGSSEWGMTEADWPDTPEARADLIARMKEIEPFELTPEEQAEIAAAREDVRKVTIDAVRKQMGLDP